MNEKGWNRTANIAGILSLVSIGLFLFKLLTGSINFWTILFFSLIVAGAVSYALIHMLLNVRKLTPAEESVVNQVSDTKEFVGFFFSTLIMLASGIGFEFFSGKPSGKVAGTFLFVYTVTAALVKVYDIYRLTIAKQKHVRLVNTFAYRRLSQAEKIGLVIFLIGLLGMLLVPPMILLCYLGLMVFLIRLVSNRVEGRIIDLFLMRVNIAMIIISAILVFFK
ncbi:hypothetical protein [Pediococcus pentosaceus]|uniref:UbiA prenyltransferase family protein n=1 Tax=Pediococcus pentosaceus TaxID=1255 RepID=A0AB73HF97_PEDPE|nr:hypothetical protein [Pediococcus pentosaceus]MBF7115148.1 hypothetical protein [Pediococcus pentosaceus]MCM6793641.1 hypothetical protein [Pediococcus pentosaceus]MCM6810944.1 hypothetical protein [Pediococcus pentosaceus]MCM6812585.1 hypothetical protein [Pediococcus pentosaceus]MCM6818956.1 hypothetical protein [Pediococcus pentosaceus]